VRIAYLCHWNLDGSDGVSWKVRGQAAQWRAAGHEATVFAISPGTARSDDGLEAFPYRGGRERLGATIAAVHELRRRRPDVLYLRYDVFLPPVWALVRRVPTVVEVNSDTGRAMRAQWRGPAAVRFNLVNRRAVFSGVDGFVAVTNELARSEQVTRWQRPAIAIANGVDVATIPSLPAPANASPRALFLGSAGQAWHGVDKIVELAHALPELTVDVIGYRAADVLPRPDSLPPNVTFHGRLPRDEYARIAAQADLAFGSLALHRVQLDEGGPLKVREYLAMGIPLVIGYDDTDLQGLDASWLLRLPNREENVMGAVGRIRDFAQAVRGLRVPREEIAPRIDAAEKERRRLEFLSSFVS